MSENHWLSWRLGAKGVALLSGVFATAAVAGAVAVTTAGESPSVEAEPRAVATDDKSAMAEVLTVPAAMQEAMTQAVRTFLDAWNRHDVPAILAATFPGGFEHENWAAAAEHSVDFAFEKGEIINGSVDLHGTPHFVYQVPGWRALAQAEVVTEKSGTPQETRFVVRKHNGEWKVW